MRTKIQLLSVIPIFILRKKYQLVVKIEPAIEFRHEYRPYLMSAAVIGNIKI